MFFPERLENHQKILINTAYYYQILHFITDFYIFLLTCKDDTTPTVATRTLSTHGQD
jgi:hypothetical protein